MVLHPFYTLCRGNNRISRVAIGHDTTVLLRPSGSSQPSRSKLAMPRRQKKAPAPENDNEALTLLTLQQQVHQLTEARATLANVLFFFAPTP